MASNPPKIFEFCSINWVFPRHTFWLVIPTEEVLLGSLHPCTLMIWVD
jgi:hypothetical protein